MAEPRRPKQRVLVVSIDAAGPRWITPETMPRLCALAAQGASCFEARTVDPPITMPAHMSLLRGVDPSVHGIRDNDSGVPDASLTSFLGAARGHGLRTAALLNWAPLNAGVQPDDLDIRWYLNGGYGGDDDSLLTAAAPQVFAADPAVAFAYLVAPDNAGHDHGWGSARYIDALQAADESLGALIDAWGEQGAIIVTTDHSGHARTHDGTTPVDYETFVVMRAEGVAPCSMWPAASILDIAPTVAELAGFAAPGSWSGTSLVGTEQSIVDHLAALVESMAAHTYGERVDMLAHSLQAAAAAAADDAPDEMVLAALLHDIGHLLDEAGRWGIPDHAGLGGKYLQAWLPPAVVEPIRLHVEAKRFLVADDPAYRDRLSVASIETLAHQGGPLSTDQAAAFAKNDWADAAVALRRYDDDGKSAEASPAGVSEYRELLDRFVGAGVPSARWLRDSCVCPQCRDPHNGQHLIDVTEVDGWRIIGHRGPRRVELVDTQGCRHVVVLDAEPTVAPTPRDRGRSIDTARDRGRSIDTPRDRGRSIDTPRDRGRSIATEHHGSAGDLAGFARDLVDTGLAVATGLSPEPGSVLEFAARLGFVRETNYGTLFDVRSTPDPNNLAYTSVGLPLHTDNPYRDPIPTVQLLHCLVPASTGGDTVFADGFAAAAMLRAEAPAHFETLTETPVTFRFSDAQVHLEAVRPLIDLNPDGQIVAVAVNHRSMDAPPPGPATDRFYSAYLAFVELLNRPESKVEISLRAGDVVGFDNRRMLHARTAFEATEPRHLQGCYIDIDAIRSTTQRQRVAVPVMP